MFVYGIIITIIGCCFYKYSPEIIEKEREEANNFLRRIIAKYTTVFLLRIISIIIISIGLFGIISFIIMNVKTLSI